MCVHTHRLATSAVVQVSTSTLAGAALFALSLLQVNVVSALRNFHKGHL